MKKILTLVALVLPLSACGPADTEAADPDGGARDTLVDAENTLTMEQIEDKAFLVTVRKDDPTLRVLPDGTLTSIGRGVCRDIDRVPITDSGTLFVYVTSASEAADEDLSFLVGAAIGAYCPEDSYLTQP